MVRVRGDVQGRGNAAFTKNHTYHGRRKYSGVVRSESKAYRGINVGLEVQAKVNGFVSD